MSATQNDDRLNLHDVYRALLKARIGDVVRFASPADFLAFRSKVQAEVAREEAAARLAAGDLPRTKILTRFI